MIEPNCLRTHLKFRYVGLLSNFFPKKCGIRMSETFSHLKFFCYSIPDDITIRPLKIEDIDSIYDVWPQKDVWTVDEIIYAIQCNVSFGLFTKNTNDIRAWVMFAHYGGVRMLYTKEDFRRLGYARLLVKLITKELAKIGVTPSAAIMAINAKSLALFNGLGYEKVTDIKYFNVCDK